MGGQGGGVGAAGEGDGGLGITRGRRMTAHERDFWEAGESGMPVASGRSDADAPRARREPRIDTPALNIYLGSTPALAGLWLDQYRLRDLLPQDRRPVASLYIHIDAPPPYPPQLAPRPQCRR